MAENSLTSVLYATLTFPRDKYVHEAEQDKAYQKWLTSLARTTRCCLLADAGWDEKDQHLHLEVRCPSADVEKFFDRLPRFNQNKAWSHRHYDCKRWDPSLEDQARQYIRVKHNHTQLAARGSNRHPCRKKVCRCLEQNG